LLIGIVLVVLLFWGKGYATYVTSRKAAAAVDHHAREKSHLRADVAMWRDRAEASDRLRKDQDKDIAFFVSKFNPVIKVTGDLEQENLELRLKLQHAQDEIRKLRHEKTLALNELTAHEHSEVFRGGDLRPSGNPEQVDGGENNP
jgi:adenylate kinase